MFVKLLQNILKRPQILACFSLSSLYLYKYKYQPIKFYNAPIFTTQLAWCEGPETPYLGISIRSLNDKPGMEIMLVNTDSPAWHSGLKLGDILIEIEGKQINNIGQYKSNIYDLVVTKK